MGRAPVEHGLNRATRARRCRARVIVHWASRLVALAVLLAPATAGADDAAVRKRIRDLKRFQQQIVLEGASAKMESRARRLAQVRQRRGKRAGAASRPPREPGAPFARGRPALVPRASGSSATPPNRLMSNPLTDTSIGSTQSENAIAAQGAKLVGAWNDGEITKGVLTGIGFGWSIDGGVTWVDGGSPPRAGGVLEWISDPVITVDEISGSFYLVALAIATGPSNALAMVKGAFTNDVFQWEVPRVIRTVRDTLPDKPWIVADSSSGVLHVSYTTFFRADSVQSDQIEFQRSTDEGLTWSPATVVSPPEERGLVQGSRPVVGPAGDLHVVWKTVDTTDASDGRDFIRLRSSNDQGASFGSTVTVAGAFSNFGSGAPGFNRGNGLAFPGIAIDRSAGPHRGRIYVTWNESLNFYDDEPGQAGQTVESEPNAAVGDANPVTIGEVVRGEIANPSDTDLFRFDGVRGQTVIVEADSVTDTLDVSLRLYCRTLATQLAFSAPVRVVRRLLVFTLPENGEYLLRLAPLDNAPGGYRLRTGFAESGDERARDHRDVFVTTSDDAVNWSEPVLATDDPPWFDDWLPEVAVAGNGDAFALWYDWRDTPAGQCGAVSGVHLARSRDGGATWEPLGAMTEVGTDWSAVFSNLSPNHGDYLTLFADRIAVHASWGDGRRGTPDAMMASRPLEPTPVLVSLSSVEAEPDHVRIEWFALRGTVATVERQESGGPWISKETLAANGSGLIVYEDRDVRPGTNYGYRLQVDDGGEGYVTSTVWVLVPVASPGLAILNLQPNPATRDLFVTFAIPGTHEPAFLELVDAGGRVVRTHRVEGATARGVVNVTAGRRLPAGVYVVRLRQGTRTATAKAVIIR